MSRPHKLSLLALLTATSVALTACGTDDNTVASSAPAAATSAATAATSAESADTSAAAPGTVECAEGDLRSSGSTAQGKVMEQWILDFNAKCGADIGAYQGGGSGKGISDFTGNQVDFAGSDSALKADQAAAAKADRCAGADAINLPMVTGPIALAYNVPGVTDLTLNADVLAGIFNGIDHQLERSRDRRAQQRRHAAGPDHPVRPPPGGLGHHRELHPLPQGGGAGGVDRSTRPRRGPPRVASPPTARTASRRRSSARRAPSATSSGATPSTATCRWP